MTPAETVSRWAMFLDKPIEVEDAIAALVKAERERAEPKPDDDGWIVWQGGLCPVDTRQSVEIRLREHEKPRRSSAGDFSWIHIGTGAGDIIAYRILPSQVTK